MLALLTPLVTAAFPIDVSSQTFFLNINSPFFNNVFYAASWLFNSIPGTILVLLSGLVVYKYFGKREAVIFVLAPLIAVIISTILKYSIGAARPVGGLIHAVGPSFPSGHTTLATAYFLMLLHFLKHTTYVTRAKNPIRAYRRGVHYAFCIACPLFVGVSRLYFGVHWLSDVIAGYIIGAAVVYFIIRFLDFKLN